MKKNIYLVAGIIFMSIGTLGYFLPILPGTIFMILAAYCFLHSSDKLYSRVVNHPNYGPPIKEYVENGRIAKKSKVIILLSIWVASLISVFYINPHLYLKILTIFLAIMGSVMVLRAKN